MKVIQVQVEIGEDRALQVRLLEGAPVGAEVFLNAAFLGGIQKQIHQADLCNQVVAVFAAIDRTVAELVNEVKAGSSGLASRPNRRDSAGTV